jgi:thiol-disulfide isomerase/thioredoxin
MSKNKNFWSKHWSNILFLGILLLIIIPQTRKPIQVTLNRIVAFSPTEIKEGERQILNNYNWSLKNNAGDKINLSRSEDKVILLNYWATWCAPCIAELPDLENLYADYKQEIDFYFITSEDPKVVNSFLKKRNSSIVPHYLLSPPPNVLKSNSLPTTYLIDSNGEIVMKKTRAANWNSKTVRTTIDKIK